MGDAVTSNGVSDTGLTQKELLDKIEECPWLFNPQEWQPPATPPISIVVDLDESGQQRQGSRTGPRSPARIKVVASIEDNVCGCRCGVSWLEFMDA
jgi:hypothetical protein